MLPAVARAERLISTAVLGFAASEAAGRFRHHDQPVIDEDFAELLRWLRLVPPAASDGPATLLDWCGCPLKICPAWDHGARGTALLAHRERGGVDEQIGQGQRRDAGAAEVLRSGPARRPGVPGLGGVLPAAVAAGPARLGRPGPVGLRHGL